MIGCQGSVHDSHIGFDFWDLPAPQLAPRDQALEPGPSLCSPSPPVSGIRDRQMTEYGSCHRTPERRGSLEESRWASQTPGLSLAGQAGICQAEKERAFQAERTAGAKAWEGDPPISKHMAWSPWHAEATDLLLWHPPWAEPQKEPVWQWVDVWRGLKPVWLSAARPQPLEPTLMHSTPPHRGGR